MITLRRAGERGHANHGWLDTFHTFSFADYYDPEHLGFRALRVINDDTVQGGQGFGTHGHRDMEIISYVLEGALAHQDSMGSGSTLRYGDVQAMSAGTGVMHSEFNGDARQPVHFLQIWLLPERKGLAPRYLDKHFPPEGRQGRLQLLASRDGREGALPIHQDADVYATVLQPGQAARLALRAGRQAWVQLARGELTVNGQQLAAGDGAALSGEAAVELAAANAQGEALVFDLA